MAATDWIDSTGDSPAVMTGKAVTGLLGTVIVGWWLGVLEFLTGFGDGVSSTLDGVADWFSTLVASLFAAPGEVYATAAAENAAFLSNFGAFAVVVATIEIAVVVWLLLLTIKLTISTVWGAI